MISGMMPRRDTLLPFVILAVVWGVLACGCQLGDAATPTDLRVAPAAVAEPQAADDDGKTAEPGDDGVAMDDRDRALVSLLSGVELVGRFTLDGDVDDDGNQPLREERYTIASITKIGGNLWKFDCRIRYMDVDVAVPVPLRVSWAGDTPVIGVTNAMIPGAGKYTARVLFHGDKYAGTWSGDGYGGHLFGRIERPAADDDPTDTDEAGTDAPSADTGK